MNTELSRRHVLQLGAGAFVLAASTSGPSIDPAMASAKMQQGQVPGYYRFKLGEFEVTVLSDGAYTLPTDMVGINQPREKVQAFLKANMLDPDQRLSHVNIPLINTGKELVLVDVGGGANFLTGAGQLVENMKAAGYKPEQVDKVIITHGHPDHIWGLIDDFDEPTFPNAKYIFAKNEWAFWSTKAAQEKLPEDLQAFAAGALRRLPVIEDKTSQVKPEQEISPGIFALDTPGHTPGHISLLVKSGSETLMVAADAITHPYISFEHPGWWPRTDTDPKSGEKSRRKLLDMAVADKMLMLSYHISFPGLGRVAKAGSAYRWLPETWQWKL